MSEEFSHNAEEGNASIAVTGTPVTFIFVESADVNIPYMLQYCAFSPVQAEYLVQPLHEAALGTSNVLDENIILFRVFSWSDYIYHFAQIIHRWFAVRFMHGIWALNAVQGI